MKSILLVNDKEHVHDMDIPAEFQEKYVLQHAYDGKEALDIIHAGGIDLLVTDLIMPEMDGFTLMKTLRSEGYQLPILATSNDDFQEDALHAGANIFLELGLDTSKDIWDGIRKIDPQ